MLQAYAHTKGRRCGAARLLHGMSKMQIIAFTGKAGAGKSTCAAHLNKKIDGSYVLKFAKSLYHIHDLILSTLSGVLPEAHPKKDRRLLQLLGTDWGREIDPNIWVKAWEEEVSRLSHDVGLIICDDVRFDNEAEAVLRLGGKIVLIDDGKPRLDDHISEKGLAKKYICGTVYNSGSLDQLQTTLEETLERLGVFTQRKK